MRTPTVQNDPGAIIAKLRDRLTTAEKRLNAVTDFPAGRKYWSRYSVTTGTLPGDGNRYTVRRWALTEGAGRGVTLEAAPGLPGEGLVPLAMFTLSRGLWEFHACWDPSGGGYGPNDYLCWWVKSADDSTFYGGDSPGLGYALPSSASGQLTSDGTTGATVTFASSFAWGVHDLQITFRRIG